MINNVRQKNDEDMYIALFRSIFDAIRLYIAMKVTITNATAANISGRRDLSNSIRKNVSLALAPVMLDPITQKNIIISINVGALSSDLIFIIFILYFRKINYIYNTYEWEFICIYMVYSIRKNIGSNFILFTKNIQEKENLCHIYLV